MCLSVPHLGAIRDAGSVAEGRHVACDGRNLESFPWGSG